MTVSTAIRSGLRAAARTKFQVFVFYGCNLLVAAALAAPMHDAIAAHLGNSKMGDDLVRGLSSAWLTEFQIANDVFLRGFTTAIVYAGILFLLLNTILSAGAFEVFAQGEGAGMHAFGRGIGKYFARFVRLALIASVLYFIAFAFWNAVAGSLIERAFRNSAREGGEFYLTLLRNLLLLLTVFVINAVVEYAKADMVLEQHRSAFAALGHAAGFVLRRFGRVMAIYIGVGLFSAATIVVYAVFARYFPQHSEATILIWFVVGQVLLWFRWMFRLASWGATVAFYRSLLPVPVPEPAPAPALETAEA